MVSTPSRIEQSVETIPKSMSGVSITHLFLRMLFRVIGTYCSTSASSHACSLVSRWSFLATKLSSHDWK